MISIKVYLITALLAVATVSTAEAGAVKTETIKTKNGCTGLPAVCDPGSITAAPPGVSSDNPVLPTKVRTIPARSGRHAACTQRGGSWVTLTPRTVEGNPWAKTIAPVSGCWEAKEPIITFAEGPPIQLLDCDWRKLFEPFLGAKSIECLLIGNDARAVGKAYEEIAKRVIKRRGTNDAPPPVPVAPIPMQKLRGIADI